MNDKPNMPKISEAEVKKMAKLARLKLSDKEVEDATEDLSGILGNFSAIQAIDTKDTVTSDNVTGLENITREDEPDQGDLASPKDLLEVVPETKDGQIKVRAVFE